MSRISFKLLATKLLQMRYILIGLMVIASTIYWQFGHKKEVISGFFGIKRELVCDTTHVASYSIFDLSYLIKSNFLLNYKNNKVVYITENQDSTFSYLIFDKNLKSFETNASDTLLNNYHDSTAFAALILPNNNLYFRWEKILIPSREDFVLKRESTLENLRADFPNYRFKVNIDLRAVENQSKLLATGKSATALSLHQFGLASDIAIFKGKYYLQKGSSYHMLGTESKKNNLFWGGDLVGMPDPNHIQFFKNSAELLSKIPALKYEFAPYISFYEKRVEDFTKKGKAYLVKDSEELLQIIDVLDENKLCGCKTSASQQERNQIEQIVKSKSGVIPEKDFILFKNQQADAIILIDSTLGMHRIRLGTWR